jgi:hypothetical protein
VTAKTSLPKYRKTLFNIVHSELSSKDSPTHKEDRNIYREGLESNCPIKSITDQDHKISLAHQAAHAERRKQTHRFEIQEWEII